MKKRVITTPLILAALLSTIVLHSFIRQSNIESTDDSITSGNLVIIQNGITAVTIDGAKHTLSNPCLEADDTIYLPLPEIVELLNGTTRSMPDGLSMLAKVSPFPGSDYGRSVHFWANSNLVSFNGQSTSLYFGGTESAEVPVPKIINQTFYLPLDYMRYLNISLSYDAQDFGANIILANFVTEYGTCGIELNEELGSIPEEIMSEMYVISDTTPLDSFGYEGRLYSNGAIEMMVCRLATSDDSPDNPYRVMEITLLTDECSTPRGLRVGDDSSQLELLYGRDLPMFMNIEFDNDERITRIHFFVAI